MEPLHHEKAEEKTQPPVGSRSFLIGVLNLKLLWALSLLGLIMFFLTSR